MDFSWINLNDPFHQLIIGGAGNLLGNVTEKVAGNWISALKLKQRSRYQSPLPQEAVKQALSYALVETISTITADEKVFETLLRRFDQWLENPDVISEFSEYLLVPEQAGDLNLEVLKAAYGKLGYNADTMTSGHDFAEIVATLADKFCVASASQPALQGVLDTDLLRQAVKQLTQLVQSGKEQNETLKRLEALAQNTTPLNLQEQERAYLNGLYEECNRLPLVRSAKNFDQKQPRLQRVYVDLFINQPPGSERILDRLGIHDKAKRRRALERLNKSVQTATHGRKPALADGDAEFAAESALLFEAKGATGRLDGDGLKKLAEHLKVEVDDLGFALRPLTPIEALVEKKQLLILGDPGSGKSTLTQRLAALFAAAGVNDSEILRDLSEEEVADLEQLLQIVGRRLLPVRIVLNQWALHLAEEGKGCAADLIEECFRVVGESGKLNQREQEGLRQRLLGATPTLLLLLDGLDEVSSEVKRSKLLDALADFRRHHRAVLLMVTCRVRPYAAFSPELKENLPAAFTLAPLNSEAITTFIQRWYGELVRVSLDPKAAQNKVNERQRDLLSALDDPKRGRLREMAGTPLLLTMMARLNYDKPLPNSRAELYEQFVDLLFYEWEQLKQDERKRKVGLDFYLDKAGIDRDIFAHHLNKLAFTIHNRSRNRDTVEIQQNELEAMLRDAAGSLADKAQWAIEVLTLIADRSGILYATDTTANRQVFKFSHRTFQEYLAACWLATGLTETLQKAFLIKLQLNDPDEEENWREAILLAFGHLIFTRKSHADALNILDANLPTTLPGDELGIRRLLLLGEVYTRLLTLKGADAAGNDKQAKRVFAEMNDLLTAAMQSRHLPPRTRLEAGLLLADLDIDPPGLDDFIPIPGTDVRIGKYPVTNKQFRRFVEAKGYETREWWSEEGWQYQEKYGVEQPPLWNNPTWNHSTQPMVDVSWYECEAYCNWLSQSGHLLSGYCARLPSEEEWTAAARNGQPEPEDESTDYPWIGTFEAWRANTEESKLEQTSPVYMYPDGVSGGGVWDLSGNVCEWTSDKDEDGSCYLKGGSWYFKTAQNLTVMSNVGDPGEGPDPRDGDDNIGCRVVVGPISHGSES